MKKLLIVFLVFCSNQLISQTSEVDTVKNLLLTNKISEANTFVNALPDTFYNAGFTKDAMKAFVYANTNKVDSAIILLKIESNRIAPFYTPIFMNDFDHFSILLLNDSLLANLRAYNDSVFYSKNNKLDLAIVKIIRPLHAIDQYPRNLMFYYYDTNADSLKIDKVKKRIDVLSDSIQKEVVKILDQYGYPSKQMIGDYGSIQLFVLIQHGSDDFQWKYRKLMKHAFKCKDLDPMGYAMFLDRLLVNRNKKQLYGTQYNFETETIELYPVRNPKRLEKRKEKIKSYGK